MWQLRTHGKNSTVTKIGYSKRTLPEWKFIPILEKLKRSKAAGRQVSSEVYKKDTGTKGQVPREQQKGKEKVPLSKMEREG